MLYTPLFWSLYAANLLTVASFGAFFLFPLYVTAHGGTEADVGLVMGIFAFASAACRPWVAEMVDRCGRRRSYLIGGALMTLLPLCYLPLQGDLATFLLPLLLLRILHGVGLAICFTSVFTFVADVVPPERLNEGLGIFGTSGLVGVAVGPFVAELILKSFGFNAYFLCAALLAGLAWICMRPLPEATFELDTTPAPSFFQLLLRPKLAVTGSLSLLFGFGVSASGNFVAPLATARDLPLASAFFVFYSITAILVRIGGGRRIDRWGEQSILSGALFIFGLGLILLVTVDSIGLLILAGIVGGLGHGLLFPALNAMAVRNEPPSLRGKATGIFTGSIDAGIFAGSFILGYIGELAGLDMLFFVAGGVFFPVAVIYPVLRKKFSL